MIDRTHPLPLTRQASTEPGAVHAASWYRIRRRSLDGLVEVCMITGGR